MTTLDEFRLAYCLKLLSLSNINTTKRSWAIRVCPGFPSYKTLEHYSKLKKKQRQYLILWNIRSLGCFSRQFSVLVSFFQNRSNMITFLNLLTAPYRNILYVTYRWKPYGTYMSLISIPYMSRIWILNENEM